MSLFQSGYFQLASGQFSTFKVDCDHLTDGDIDTVARMLVHRLPSFYAVEGVPTGGLRLAEAMRQWTVSDAGIFLIVDDVFTSGGSMEKFKAQTTQRYNDPYTKGAVIFDRSIDGTPDWITPLWRLTP